MVYPVGSVYINANDNRNPKEILNWTTSVWARFAVGMTLVGAEGSTNSEKMAAMWNKPSNISLVLEKEFGAFVHSLTEEELAPHTHKSIIRYGNESGRSGNPWGSGSDTSGYEGDYNFATGSAGEGKGHNNVQPSVVVAMWRRIG